MTKDIPLCLQAPNGYHKHGIIPLVRGIKHKTLYMNQLNKSFRTYLGTWPIFTWELGPFLLGNLARFCLGTWPNFDRKSPPGSD